MFLFTWNRVCYGTLTVKPYARRYVADPWETAHRDGPALAGPHELLDLRGCTPRADLTSAGLWRPPWG